MIFNKRDLINDVELYLNTYATEYTKNASVEFTKVAKKTIIDVFYGQYSPEYYVRTDDLKNNSMYEYFHDNGRVKYGGVIIGDRDMSDYVGSWNGDSSVTPASCVVSWTWRSGYHGYTGGDPANSIHTFPPLGALEMEVGTIIPQLQDKASTVAKSQKYSVLQF